MPSGGLSADEASLSMMSGMTLATTAPAAAIVSSAAPSSPEP